MNRIDPSGLGDAGDILAPAAEAAGAWILFTKVGTAAAAAVVGPALVVPLGVALICGGLGYIAYDIYSAPDQINETVDSVNENVMQPGIERIEDRIRQESR